MGCRSVFEIDPPTQSLKKTKEVVEVFKAIGVYADVERSAETKRQRAGKGKRRGRRYVQKKSVLLVIGKMKVL